MIDLLRSALDAAGDHVPLVLACILLCAALDAALGVGAVLPGETGVVLGAVVLAPEPGLVALGVIAAAAGAFAGDHVGFTVGRTLGPGLGRSQLVTWLGRERWHAARTQVAGRFWVVIAARLLPGVRTLVAAAAGASPMRYRRFAAACGLAAVLWASLWVIGGALVGSALLTFAERYTLPTLLAVAIGVVVLLWMRLRRRARSRA